MDYEQKMIHCDDNWVICHPKCTYCGRRTQFTDTGPVLVQAGCFGNKIMNGGKWGYVINFTKELEMFNGCTYAPKDQSFEEWCFCNEKDGCNMKKT